MLAVGFVMIFTRWFTLIGIVYLVMGFIDYKNDCVYKLYFKTWGINPPQKVVYVRLGLMTIICALLIDVLIWLAF